nr:hypothetical protein [Tanacetum cinerariifolium]
MDVKSAFLYGTIEKEVYVYQSPGFEDPEYPDKVYKVVKALYGLHQAPRAWYETLATYLLENGFERWTIYQTLFIKKQQKDILLVQIYVDDIIFGLQVKQKKDGIFISQDKYVAEILRKFGLSEGKSASTLINTEKPLLKDSDSEDVDVYTYRVFNSPMLHLLIVEMVINSPWMLSKNWLVQKQMAFGKDISNPFMVDNLPKIVWFSTHHITCMKSWLVQKQTALGKDTSNPLIVDSLLKTIWFSIHHHLIIEVLAIPWQMTTGVNTPRSDEDRLKLMELMVFLLQMDVCVDIGITANTASVKRSGDVTRLQALVDKKKIMISEVVIREILQLDDAEGMVCLPNGDIFAGLAQMGYEKPSTKLTFYKAFFSSQWKFLIHTILQSLSAKRTSWIEFSTAMASVVICLSKGQKFNFQIGDLSTHTTRFISPALTQKVFANMRRVAKGFSGVETPLFEEHVAEDVSHDAITSPPSHDTPSPSQVQTTPPQQPHLSPQVPPQGADFPTHFQHVLDTCSALIRHVEHLEHDYVAQKLENVKLNARVKKLEKTNKVKSSKFKLLRKVGASRRVESTDEMEDVFNQGRMINEDEGIELVKDADTKGRQADKQAEIYHIDLDHPSKVLSMQEDDSEVQKVVEFVTTAKLITDVVTTAALQVSAASATIPAAKPSIPAAAPTAAKRRKLNEEARETKELKNQLEIVNDEDDDVFTEATALGRKVGASRRVESTDEMEDVFNQGRMINEDEGIELVKDADTKGRQADKQAEIYHIDLDHPSKVLSMQEDDSEVQKVVEFVTTAKLITDVVTTAALQVSAASATIPAAKPSIPAAAPTDKGKGILVESPKPMKKRDQIKLDAEYARKLHEEINKDDAEFNKDID